jgi:YidC/Oxa1 family membrane protein insertase
MMSDHRNTILAVILSGMVLIGWQYFFVVPQMEQQKAQQQRQQQAQQTQSPGAPTQQPQAGGAPAPAQPDGAAPAQPVPGQPPRAALTVTRDAALAASPRVKIDTPKVSGSIALKGGRIDDVSLTQYRVTVDPKSPAVTLFSPSGSPNPYYAEFGWVGASGANVKLPDATTDWKQEGSNALTVSTPVTLTYDNGGGLVFRRTISVDENYLFTVKDDVKNNGTSPVTLYPFALVSRHGTPHVEGFYILHEGMIGVLGDQGLQEITYSAADEKQSIPFKVTNGWLGITDKYWAATLLPDPSAALQARFSSTPAGTSKTYQADYLLDAQTVAPGGSGTAEARLFAGAKETPLIDAYDRQLKLNRFELLIDWGWFYFITKPMFWSIDYLFRLVGNFGVAILLVTVLIKTIFFPLANKSYASMAKMKNIQPEMVALRERYPDDKQKQQQEMMALYKREKINPVAGCLPILIQIPVFFALYKVLFVTIEMRHAPFFGWIKDLSAADPTNIFNLFGLIPYDPTTIPVFGPFLVLGIWPIIMGITMWVQMKLNPSPPDPTQKMIFDWMPLIFTFMLASFPAGLVIYWAWNNLLSVIQQSIIMKKNGAKIELFDNIRSTFKKPEEKPDSPKPSAKQDNKPAAKASK